MKQLAAKGLGNEEASPRRSSVDSLTEEMDTTTEETLFGNDELNEKIINLKNKLAELSKGVSADKKEVSPEDLNLNVVLQDLTQKLIESLRRSKP